MRTVATCLLRNRPVVHTIACKSNHRRSHETDFVFHVRPRACLCDEFAKSAKERDTASARRRPEAVSRCSQRAKAGGGGAAKGGTGRARSDESAEGVGGCTGHARRTTCKGGAS